ncbi:NAD(P)-binding protein [Thozetella sp. PMI_491]|nr:NAD(P)-binding protein [Thozetella sp. PMI_491]
MAATKPLVLLTGASGFLGFITLLDLLQSGYRVRASVRSQAKADKVRAALQLKGQDPASDALSFVLVPDMTVSGAYDAAAQGVDYIVHVASPIPSFGADNGPTPEQYEAHFVNTAVASDLGMLHSAAKSGGSVKRIVLTSSAVGIIPFDYSEDKPGMDYSVPFGPDSRVPDPKGPFGSEFEAYSAGKVAALNAAEKWVAENGEKFGFDLITIIPGWIFGRDELIESAMDMRAGGSTNSVLLGLLRGGKNDVPFNGNAVLGTDVARAHVLALRKEVKGNQSFIASTRMVWEDSLRVLQEEFSKDVAEGRLSIEGKQPTQPMEFDASKTEEVLGIRFAPFSEQVRQVASQYLELLAKA